MSSATFIARAQADCEAADNSGMVTTHPRTTTEPAIRVDRASAVLFHHGFCASPPDAIERRYCLCAEQFDEQLRYMGRHFEFVSLSELLDGASREHARPSLALTFDDAMVGFYEHAVPRLVARRIPFLVAIPTAMVGVDRPLWSIELTIYVLASRARVSFRLGRRRVTFGGGSIEHRHKQLERLRYAFFLMTADQRDAALAELRATVPDGVELLERYRGLRVADWQTIRSVPGELVEYAVHGRTHVPLRSDESLERLTEETALARDELERETGVRSARFCMPYGAAIDGVDPAIDRRLSQAGYSTLLVTDNRSLAHRTAATTSRCARVPRIAAEIDNAELFRASENGWRDAGNRDRAAMPTAQRTTVTRIAGRLHRWWTGY